MPESTTSSVTLDLPLPPSVNRIWRSAMSRDGRVYVHRSPEYKRWMEQAILEWVVAKPPGFKIIDEYDVVLILHFPDRRKRDLANYEKALSDACQKAGIIKDDSGARSLLIRKGCKCEAPLGARIIITPLDKEGDIPNMG